MTERRSGLWVALLTLLAAAARLPLLSHESLWKDELSIWTFVNVPTLGQAVHNGAVVDPHPILYMLLVFPIVHMLGMSEAAFRLPSALLGIASVPLIYILAKRLFTWREGLASAAFMALMYRPIFYSLEGRNYMLLGFGSICLGIAWVSITDAILARRRLAWSKVFGYSALVVLAPYSHYFGALLAATMFLHLAVLSMTERSGRINVLQLFLFTAIFYAPWIPVAAKTFGRSSQAFWIDKPHLDAPLVLLTFYYGRFPLVVGLMTLFAAFFFWSALSKGSDKPQNSENPQRERAMAIMLTCWLVVPVIVTIAKSVLSTSFFLNRYFFICLPAAYVCAARGISLVANRRGAALLQGSVAFLLAASWAYMIFVDRFFTRPQKSEYRQAVAYIGKRVALDPEPVLTTQPMLSYYTDRPGSHLKLVAADHQDSILPSTKAYLEEVRPREFWYLDAQDDYKLNRPLAFQPDGYAPVEEKRFKDVLAIRYLR